MSGVNGEPLGVSGRSMRDIFEVDLDLSPDSYSEGNQQRRSSPKEGQPPPPPLERSQDKHLPAGERSPRSKNNSSRNHRNVPEPHLPSSSSRYEGGGGGQQIPWDEVLQPPGDKPKRPLSAYNFFFQLERERIINSDLKDRDAVVKYTVDDVARIAMVQQQKAKNGKTKEKRSHRRTHGKISFGDLARTIANKWKQLDESSKSIFEGSATMEKERYRKELGEWNKKQKKWKDATAKMTQQRGVYPPSIVTPTQVPKSTMHSDGHHLMTTLMHQQKKLLQDSGFAGSPSTSPRNENRLQQPYPEYRPGAAAADMFEAEQEYYRQDFVHQGRRFGGGPMGFGSGGPSSGPYDYDRLTDDTYQMAQMALPRYQQMWMQQRRMQEMALMQQQQEQMRQQISSGRQQQHPDDYLMDRVMDRALDRGMDRGGLAGGDRGLDRSLDRGMDRQSLDRGMDRTLDRGMDRALDRGMDRSLDRAMDRGFDRAALDRGMGRVVLDRGMDRVLDRSMGRSVDRDLDRGMDRASRPTDREMDRTSTPTDMLLKEEMPMESSPHPYHQSELRASYDI